MRKRNCDRLFDNVMWYLIYLLPLIVALLIYKNAEVFNIVHQESGFIPTNFGAILYDILYDFGLSIDGSTLVSAIYDVFGFFGTTGNELGICAYFAYFVIIYCMHLMVDFLLFIPRLAHKWMNDFTQGD